MVVPISNDKKSWCTIKEEAQLNLKNLFQFGGEIVWERGWGIFSLSMYGWEVSRTRAVGLKINLF